MIIHCNHIGQVKQICDHFSIPINTAELELSFPYAFHLLTVNSEPLNDDNEYTFEEFKEKYFMIIKNAVIESVALDTGDSDLLTAWLHLDYGGLHQGFGGAALYLPKSYKHHNEACSMNFAGHWIFRVMEIAGVTSWDKLKGRTIRVQLDKDGLGGNIQAIGHIIKDDWFNPDEDFEKMKASKTLEQV